jgi:RNA polymerase sigma-70 factor (ECF subfamily)
MADQTTPTDGQSTTEQAEGLLGEPAAPKGATERQADQELVRRLLAGDEAAFSELVRTYHGAIVRLARPFVADAATAEEVAQDTWVGVLKGLERFEGRSSLKTWIFRILVNRAKTRGVRDKRMVPMAFDDSEQSLEPAVDPNRFDERGSWTAPPHGWALSDPEEIVLQDETRRCIDGAIATLPSNQRSVITLRDIQGMESEDVCNVLEISQTNQRVLLHRARSKVRLALEKHFDGE